MSKELKALSEILKWFDDEHMGLDKIVKESEEYQIVENALKRLEKIDNEPYIPLHINRYYELSKKEDVLEIIKNHIIEIREENIIEKPVNHELIIRFRKFDDMEEFELLKEVLL